MRDETYVIAILRDMYAPDAQGSRAVRYVTTDDGEMMTYRSLADARDAVRELDRAIYRTASGEAGRPDYAIIAWVDAMREIECEIDDRCEIDDLACGGCGECRQCVDRLIDHHIAYVRSVAVVETD